MENLVSAIKGIRSLNNIGSVFRTSDAFRVEEILLCGLTGYSSNFVVSEKVKVPAGETRRVTLSVPATELALYTTAHGCEYATPVQAPAAEAPVEEATETVVAETVTEQEAPAVAE